MAKKTKSFRAKNTGSSRSKNYRKPLWMRIVRLIAMILAFTVMVLGIIGVLLTYLHFYKH